MVQVNECKDLLNFLEQDLGIKVIPDPFNLGCYVEHYMIEPEQILDKKEFMEKLKEGFLKKKLGCTIASCKFTNNSGIANGFPAAKTEGEKVKFFTILLQEVHHRDYPNKFEICMSRV